MRRLAAGLLALAALRPGPALAQGDSALAHALARVPPAALHREAEGYLPVLARFYEARGWAPLWTDPVGLNPAGRSLRRVLDRTADHGLDPDDYFRAELDRLAPGAGPGARAEVEVVASLAALRAARDLGWGVTLPAEVDRDHDYPVLPFRPDSVLAALAAAPDPGMRVLAYAPATAPYRLLTRALAALRRARGAGGWPTDVAPGPTLRPGDRGPRVAALRQALAERGDLPSLLAMGDSFDASLARAVATFQARHGLEPDSVVGPRSLRELAVPVERRMEQVRLGLERLRWLPAEFGGRYIAVNLAAFRAYLMDGHELLFATNAVIGTEYDQTPMFVGRMTYLVLNPYWIVPASIARREILPAIEANPDYLARQRMELVDGTFRQRPGPWNALGRYKFMFPNRHSVYLHDTPARSLFARAERAFSHGCIRLEHPEELARLLLEGQGWSAERIRAVVEAGEQVVVPLEQPVPVIIGYATAFTDTEGRLHFRRDIYGRDATLRAALERRGRGSWEG